ncbi:MAG: hypothetical protein KGJ07_05360 [Patescibacteria group bacterium]|nr:hypothetical protein [Patescibacteria group bacterium]MDE2590589.1 hypothetical protein [Patescibacteria group bacterium]
MASEVSHTHSLKPHAFGMIGVLIVEYLLGMFSALFVNFPQGVKEGQLWKFAWQQVPVALHILVGFLLVIGTLALLIRSLVEKDRNWILASAVATIAVFGAIIGGAIFIKTQTNTYSFVMAVSFIIALVAYFWGMYTAK